MLLENAEMDEDIAGSVVADDESEAPCRVEPFDGTDQPKEALLFGRRDITARRGGHRSGIHLLTRHTRTADQSQAKPSDYHGIRDCEPFEPSGTRIGPKWGGRRPLPTSRLFAFILRNFARTAADEAARELEGVAGAKQSRHGFFLTAPIGYLARKRSDAATAREAKR